MTESAENNARNIPDNQPINPGRRRFLKLLSGGLALAGTGVMFGSEIYFFRYIDKEHDNIDKRAQARFPKPPKDQLESAYSEVRDLNSEIDNAVAKGDPELVAKAAQDHKPKLDQAFETFRRQEQYNIYWSQLRDQSGTDRRGNITLGTSIAGGAVFAAGGVLYMLTDRNRELLPKVQSETA
jgi:hypothetical protein